MYSFENDYSEGAHPKILERLVCSNLEQTRGYGMDAYCEQAKRLIKAAVRREDADVHFLVGGTQTNSTVVLAALRPHQALISADTGHVCVHETGAIEATGHKVISVTAQDGKLTAQMVQQAVDIHIDEHMVQPKMVYISHPTEMGTLYSKQELLELRSCCDQNGLYLFLDGARLASGLASSGTDLALEDIAQHCDVFYIGATKSGALFGEAVVILNDAIKPDFRYLIKQRGGLLAKGRTLGLQFIGLFEDGLYEQIGAHENAMAAKLRRQSYPVGTKCTAHHLPTSSLWCSLVQWSRRCKKSLYLKFLSILRMAAHWFG